MSKNIIEIILQAKDKATAVVKESEKGIKKYSDTIKKVSLAATAAGGAIVAGMKMAVSGTADVAVQIDKMHKTTGIAHEALSKLGYAAVQEHASMEVLSNGLKFLAKNMNDMSWGIGEAKDAFEAMDIQVTDSSGNLRQTDNVLLEIADKFMGMTNETEKSALAMRIFGRSGVELVPFLNMGSEAIIALGDEAQRLGIVLTKDNVEAFKRYTDTVDAAKAGMAGLKMTVANAVLPAFQDIVQGVKSGFEWFQKLPAPIKENTVKMIALTGAFLLIGGPIAGAVALMAKYEVLTKLNIAATKAKTLVLNAAAVAQKGLNIVMAANPIGLVITAVGLLVAGLVVLYKTNDTARYYMDQAWSSIKIAVASSIDFILDKLQSLTKFIPGLADKIQSYRDQISDVVDNAKAEKQIREYSRNYSKMADFRKLDAQSIADTEKKSSEVIVESLEDVEEAHEDVAKAAEEAKQKQLDGINRLYDSLRSAIKKHYDKLENDQIDAIENELTLARKATEEKLDLYDKEYRAKLKALDAETAAAIEAIEGQIDAIDSQTQAEEKAREEREMQERIASFEAQLLAAKDAEEKARIQEDLNRELEEQQRRKILDERQAQKDALRDEIDRIRENSEEKRNNLQDELQDKIEIEQKKLDTTVTRLDDEKTKIQEHYVRLKEETQIAAEAQKLIWDNNQQEILTMLKTYEPDWANQGKSFGERFLEGFKSVNVGQLIGGLIGNVPRTGSGPSGGSSGSGSSGNLDEDGQYIERTYPGGLDSYVADLDRRAAEGTEPNIAERVAAEKERIGVAHSGGTITRNGIIPLDLRDGEVPIIAEEGETILPKGMRSAGSMMPTAPSVPINLTLNFNFGTAVFAGSKYEFQRFVEKEITPIISKFLAKYILGNKKI